MILYIFKSPDNNNYKIGYGWYIFNKPCRLKKNSLNVCSSPVLTFSLISVWYTTTMTRPAVVPTITCGYLPGEKSLHLWPGKIVPLFRELSWKNNWWRINETVIAGKLPDSFISQVFTFLLQWAYRCLWFSWMEYERLETSISLGPWHIQDVWLVKLCINEPELSLYMYCVKDSFYLFSETVNIFSKDILMKALLHPSFFFYTRVICIKFVLWLLYTCREEW